MPRTYLILFLSVLTLFVGIIADAMAQSGRLSDIQADSDVMIVRQLDGRAKIAKDTIQWAILDLALRKSGRAYDLDISSHTLAPGRAIAQLESLGNEGNLIWGTTSAQREKELLPVRVPLFRGLLSYCYIWVRKDDVDRFSHIRTLSDLKKFSILQDPKWPTKAMFEAEGFDVRTGDLSNIPEMLSHSRADALIFPVLETSKLNKFGAQKANLVRLSNVLIHLPTEHYFFVAQEGQEELHGMLYTGMKAAVADGSQEALLRIHSTTKDAYHQLLNSDAAMISIENSDFSKEMLKVNETYHLDLM